MHWQAMIAGRAHLGYQREEGAEGGRWVLRRYDGSKYSIEQIGFADDGRRIADGVSVLTFEQAKAKALAALDEKPHGRITVRRAVANYVDFLRVQGRATDDAERRAVAHILPVLGDVEVAELTAERIRRWLAALAASALEAAQDLSAARRPRSSGARARAERPPGSSR